MLEAKFIDEGDCFKINIVMGKPGVARKFLLLFRYDRDLFVFVVCFKFILT